MTLAELAEKKAYRIKGRGPTRRVYVVTARGNWQAYDRIPDGAPQVTLAEIRERLARGEAKRYEDWSPGELMEAFGK